ncbi:heparinase II/III family protein [Paenibacillus pabuli]|uniref:heparinase II/III family protein n=1 Tax=Paenibacillus pabuli TaxID=1472 RepID=UPI001FFF90A0|nr:heparinase II/III family protein [Paenibacillus pabuli]UPK44322.1 heparinase II/III family protein [Paenibacillus pabuli]
MENTNQSNVSSISMPDYTAIQQAVHRMVKDKKKRGQQVLPTSAAPSICSIDAIGNALLQPELASFYTDLSNYGERALNESLPSLSFGLYRKFGDTGERKLYEDAYFERRGRVAAVALLAVHSNAPGWIETLEDMLWDVCGEYTWCLPAHLGTGGLEQVNGNIDLFAAETVHMLAEIVTIHADRLDPRIIQRIRAEAERRIFTPLYREQRTYHWQDADHNWSAVCSGCCGMAGLLLLKEEEILVESVGQTIRSMQAFLSGYGMDGGCAEGIGYWVYGFGYFVYYADMLREYSEGELDLLNGSKIAAIAAFPMRVHLSGGTFVNYSDSAEQQEIPSGLLSLLASRFGIQVDLPFHIPLFTDDPCHRWAHLLRNVMWSSPVMVLQEAGSAPAERGIILHDLGWMIGKGSLDSSSADVIGDEPLAVAFSVKAGHNDEPHNHNDLGQFMIHCGGENILCDPGAGLYTKAYFAPGRDQLFHISSSGHSVPRIEGKEQSSGREAQAQVLEADVSDDGCTLDAHLELTAAYPEAASLARYTRQFHWIGSANDAGSVAELRLMDRFQWKKRTASSGTFYSSGELQWPSVTERFMSRKVPEKVHEGQIQWHGEQATVCMTYDAAQWHADIEIINTVDHDNVPVTFYRTSLEWRAQLDNSGAGNVETDLLETMCELKFTIEPKVKDGGEHT